MNRCFLAAFEMLRHQVSCPSQTDSSHRPSLMMITSNQGQFPTSATHHPSSFHQAELRQDDVVKLGLHGSKVPFISNCPLYSSIHPSLVEPPCKMQQSSSCPPTLHLHHLMQLKSCSVLTSACNATGTDTAAHSLSRAAISMAKYPEWLEKIWEEQQSIIATEGEEITPEVRM
jgi:hypothetical protein